MDKDIAYQTVSLWVENHGTGVLVSDYLIALANCALASTELDAKVFSTLKEMECDPKHWCLWAFHTVLAYSRKKDSLTPTIVTELVHIKTLASEQIIANHGVNPWRYQLSYNPLHKIVDTLNYLP